MGENLTNRYVAETIENEGLDYAVRHYMGSDDFKDRETARLWDEAERSLNGLVKHLHDSGCDIQ